MNHLLVIDKRAENIFLILQWSRICIWHENAILVRLKIPRWIRLWWRSQDLCRERLITSVSACHLKLIMRVGSWVCDASVWGHSRTSRLHVFWIAIPQTVEISRISGGTSTKIITQHFLHKLFLIWNTMNRFTLMRTICLSSIIALWQ